MIPSIVKISISIGQQIAIGAMHVGVSAATAVLRRVLPVGHVDSTPAEPRATAESATRPPAPKKAPAKKPTRTKPAATLDEPVAPVDDDPVVYSSGPEVAASLPTEDLEEIRSKF